MFSRMILISALSISALIPSANAEELKLKVTTSILQGRLLPFGCLYATVKPTAGEPTGREEVSIQLTESSDSETSGKWTRSISYGAGEALFKVRATRGLSGDQLLTLTGVIIANGKSSEVGLDFEKGNEMAFPLTTIELHLGTLDKQCFRALLSLSPL